jgi:hypothetical protein
MNLLSLKRGMLIRDSEKLLEVVRVRDNSATAIVVLEDLKPPKGVGQQISYSSDGVWQFVSKPSDQQLAALESVRNEKLGFAALEAALEGGFTPDVLDDGELRAGDRVSWVRNGYYRVHGLFYAHRDGYCVCVTLVNGRRVALRRESITKECG